MDSVVNNYPKLIIHGTPPELYHIALLGYHAVTTYGYEGRKAYTFYFYKKYKTRVAKIENGWSIKVIVV